MQIVASNCRNGGAVGTYGDSQELALPGIDRTPAGTHALAGELSWLGSAGFYCGLRSLRWIKACRLAGPLPWLPAGRRSSISRVERLKTSLVKDGDVVKAGDVLVRMNSVQVKANAETMRVNILRRAQQRRG